MVACGVSITRSFSLWYTSRMPYVSSKLLMWFTCMKKGCPTIFLVEYWVHDIFKLPSGVYIFQVLPIENPILYIYKPYLGLKIFCAHRLSFRWFDRHCYEGCTSDEDLIRIITSKIPAVFRPDFSNQMRSTENFHIV